MCSVPLFKIECGANHLLLALTGRELTGDVLPGGEPHDHDHLASPRLTDPKTLQYGTQPWPRGGGTGGGARWRHTGRPNQGDTKPTVKPMSNRGPRRTYRTRLLTRREPQTAWSRTPSMAAACMVAHTAALSYWPRPQTPYCLALHEPQPTHNLTAYSKPQQNLCRTPLVGSGT